MHLSNLTTSEKDKAVFSHFSDNRIHYTILINDSNYEFAIHTSDINHIQYIFNNVLQDISKKIKLSYEVGMIKFPREIQGEILNRWIEKAVQRGEIKTI